MCEKKVLTKEEKQQIFQNATIVNNFIFVMLMRREGIGKKILEIILGVKIKKINIVEYEKTIDVKVTQKSVRMDVYLEDGTSLYNIEMQVENKNNIIMRARYYSSILDMNNLEKSKNYKELPETFIIFICLFDPFKQGQAKYVFNNKCQLDNGEYITMGDKSNIIILNAKGYAKANDKNLRYFLEYVATNKAGNAFMKKVDAEIQAIKADQILEGKFMTFATNYMDLEFDYKQLQKVLKQKDKALEKEQHALKKEQQALKKEQQVNKEKDQALKKEQQVNKEKDQALKKEQEVKRAVMINQLKLLDDEMVARINEITLEEVVVLREELLGE